MTTMNVVQSTSAWPLYPATDYIPVVVEATTLGIGPSIILYTYLHGYIMYDSDPAVKAVMTTLRLLWIRVVIDFLFLFRKKWPGYVTHAYTCRRILYMMLYYILFHSDAIIKIQALHWQVPCNTVYSYVPPKHYTLCTPYYYKRNRYNYYYDYYTLY